MKTIRLLYPDHVSGGLDTYYFGANLLAHILPQNLNQPLIKVDLQAPNDQEKTITDGIYAKEEVLHGIHDARQKIMLENPDKIITIGGNCLVSLAPFDYLHGRYNNIGIVWIDAHPDVSMEKDGYPNAHAMVLGALLGTGSKNLVKEVHNAYFKSSDILYVGLQGIHDYQKQFLDENGVNYKIQDKKFVSDQEIEKFVKKFDHILIHLDIDVLDENLFHSTYFANKDLVGDGACGGKMRIDELENILHNITNQTDVVGFTIAEYLPFDEHKLNKMFSRLNLFTN